MTLVQVGQLTINMDRVCYIRDLSTPTSAGGQPVPGALRLQFEDGHHLEVYRDAAALRAWMASRMHPRPEDRGASAFAYSAGVGLASPDRTHGRSEIA